MEIDRADSDIDSDCTGDDAGSDVVYVGKKESGFAVKSDSFMLFEYDGLVLRNEGLHDAPANEAGSHYIRNLPSCFSIGIRLFLNFLNHIQEKVVSLQTE